MKSLETQKEFMRLRAAGLSLKEISEKVGVAKSTCCIWEKKFSLELG
ncbi:MAG: helix-turn-helix domain-containing protein, partial [Thermoguttaceae bacterium]|nr:helix-turn-helix domain-containing protein [Thermoguttaceae bacterium]